MSWLPKRDKFDPVQASAVDFVVAQEENFYIKGEAGTGRGEVKVRGEGEEWRMLPRIGTECRTPRASSDDGII